MFSPIIENLPKSARKLELRKTSVRQTSSRVATKRPGVDVGDPDGLWKAEFAESVLKSYEDRKAGRSKSLPLEEVLKQLGLEN